MDAGIHQRPAVIGGFDREPVDDAATNHMEGEMVQSRSATVIPVCGEIGRLLGHDVGRPLPPAAPTWPVLELLVAKCVQQPTPLSHSSTDVGHPQFHMVESARS